MQNPFLLLKRERLGALSQFENKESINLTFGKNESKWTGESADEAAFGLQEKALSSRWQIRFRLGERQHPSGVNLVLADGHDRWM
jgi:prepilin-type processing-associated H-X9-DG protein